MFKNILFGKKKKVERNCKICRFFINYNSNYEFRSEDGHCQKHAPVVVSENFSQFPKVWKQHWCGDWVKQKPL